jgi:hypothetical protein
MQRFRRRYDLRHQPRSRLEPLGLDEIDIRPHGRELKNLVEAFVQTDGLDIVKDEGHAGCRLYVLEPELECCETYPEPLGKADEIIVIIQIAGRFG